jgi:hypothetical protein
MSSKKRKVSTNSIRANPKKKVYTTLDNTQKWELHQKVNRGIPRSVLAKTYNVSKSTVSRIMGHTASRMKELAVGSPSFQHNKTSELPELDARLNVWFDRERALGTPISDALLSHMAILHHRLHVAAIKTILLFFGYNAQYYFFFGYSFGYYYCY